MGWVLVTGGAKRLGAEICRALAQQGHDIVVHYRASQQEALSVAQTCRSFGVAAEIVQGDLSSQAGVSDFLQRYLNDFSDTSHLVNNVGNYFTDSLQKTGVAQWHELFQVNVHAPFHLIHALLPGIKSVRGRIINIGTLGIHARGYRRSSAYMITKESLLALTRSLAVELASDGVAVNMVSPGQLDISVDYTPEAAAALPMGRAGRVEEVARVVAFLLQPESGYITGQNIEVAGAYGL